MRFVPLPSDSSTTYRLRVTFTAVLPFPNRSYAAPSRGDRSLNDLKFVSGNVTLRFGRRGAGPIVTSGAFWLIVSYRRPPLSVRRLTVHLSCTYRPISEFTRTQ